MNDRKNVQPDERYFQHLIAKAILFRRTEKLVQQQQYGGYRANIVTYTLAFLSYKTAQRINLDKIWKEQRLSEPLESEIVKISALIHNMITNPPGGANISEWCKKEKCWEAVKGADYNLDTALESELVSVEYSTIKPTATSSIDSITDDEQKMIDKAAEVPAKTWFALAKWAKETNNFQPWLRSMLFSVGTIVSRGKKPSVKQSKQAIKALEEALDKGFIQN